MTTELSIAEHFGRLAQFGGRLPRLQKWITAQTRKQWQRATKSPCPTVGKKGW